MLFNTRDGFVKRCVATARDLTGPTLPQVRALLASGGNHRCFGNATADV